MDDPGETSGIRPRVGLFVTCLVDLFRPSVGFASVALLERAGCLVEAPESQTCCGQPAWNSGDKRDAADIARRVIAAFEPYDYLVAPSGSCAATIKKDYPAMLAEDGEWGPRAQALSAKSFELVSFLTDVMGVEAVEARLEGVATYHDSCSGLRSLDVQAQPRRLLASVEGLELREMRDPDVCCGFGGTFCVKFPDVSNAMVGKKIANVKNSGAGLLLAGDLGCLMNMAGKLQREGLKVEVRHVAEVLAGETDGPGVGDGK